MRIEDRSGRPLVEATVTLDEAEAVTLLEALADVVAGERDHLHLSHPGGPQLVVRRGDGGSDPLQRHLDWWLGPLVLLAAIFLVVGAVTVVRWAVGLL